MLRRGRIIVLSLFLLGAVFAFAQEQQEVKNDFQDISFTQTGTEGIFNVYKVIYQGETDISIMCEGVPGDKEKETVRIFAKEILTWPTLVAKSVKLIFRKEAVEINVIPMKLMYKETEYTSYLPAGITFIHTDYTMYDFRLVKDNYFIRIRGQYYGSDVLLGRMEEAVADPVKYIAVHDPEFMVKQISEINVKDTKQDGEIAQLKKELEKLRNDFEALRYAYVAVTKNGIYGKKIPIPQKDINAVLEIKTAKPSATLEEVYAEAVAKGIKITRGKTALILNTYFGVY